MEATVIERVAIIGSRPERVRAPDAEYDAAVLRDMDRKNAIRAYVESLPHDTVIVTGDADGADEWAAEAAQRCGLIWIVCHAPWKTREGKQDLSAGPRRNVFIEKIGQRAVAFLGQYKTTGSKGCLDLFKQAGKPTLELTVATKWTP
jgi:hypothetical protein